MKYFTHELIASANDWIDQSPDDQRRAHITFWRAVDQYHAELEQLKHRLSDKDWNYFRYSREDASLHDAKLVSAAFGDYLHVKDGFDWKRHHNRGRTTARLEFLNFEGDKKLMFELRGVTAFNANMLSDNDAPRDRLSDVYAGELTGVDERTLQLGFLFATGSTLVIRFKKMVFHIKRA